MDWEDQGLVFTNTTGGPLNEPYANRRLRTILDRCSHCCRGPKAEHSGHVHHAALPRVVFRELRHTGATLLLASGKPFEIVQELMGHTSITTTRRYARVIEPMRRDAAEAMDVFLRSELS